MTQDKEIVISAGRVSANSPTSFIRVTNNPSTFSRTSHNATVFGHTSVTTRSRISAFQQDQQIAAPGE